MQEWINSLIWAAVGPVRDLVVAIIARVSSIWSMFTNVLALIRRSYQGWAAIIRPWADATVRDALASVVFITWLVRAGIPKLLMLMADGIYRWTESRVDSAARWFEGLLSKTRDGLLSLIFDALAAILALRNWATANVHALAVAINRIIGHVFGPLASPQRLVMWILAPLIEALIEWALTNVDNLAESAWRRRRNLEVQALAVTERVLDRIL